MPRVALRVHCPRVVWRILFFGSARSPLPTSKRRRLTEVKLTGTLIQPKVREKIQELAAGNLARQQG